jgi:GMP synthase (glutamine-hydrolysing)
MQRTLQIKDQVGPDAIVIGAVSGGVDSSVAAMLLHKAIGPRFHAVLVDNGFLRHEEAKEVRVILSDTDASCSVSEILHDATGC